MDINDKAISQCMNNTERVNKINFGRCYIDGIVHLVGVEFEVANCLESTKSSVYRTF